MKNMTMLLVLSLMSYQALASNNKVDSLLAENTVVESPSSEGANKKYWIQ
ncbi:hypothetical protein ACLI07_03040 [Providencia huaxiensis]|nr:hypothetical protein [Providencia sp. PROV076]